MSPVWHCVLLPAALVSGMPFTDALIGLTFVYHEWERVINVPETRTTVCFILSDSCLDMFHKCPRKELFPSIIRGSTGREQGAPNWALWLPTCLLMKTLLFLHNTRKKTICSLWCSNQAKSLFNNNFICSQIYNTNTHTHWVYMKFGNPFANSSEGAHSYNYLASRIQTPSDDFALAVTSSLSRADNQTCKTSAVYEFCKSITLGKQKPKQIEKSYK